MNSSKSSKIEKMEKELQQSYNYVSSLSDSVQNLHSVINPKDTAFPIKNR